MRLITKEVLVSLNGRNIQHFEDLGYIIPRGINKRNELVVLIKSKILVKVKDLSNGSDIYVDVQCDGCNKIIPIKWSVYKRYAKDNDEYYCQKCATNGYQKWKSFEQWCIENDRQDILDRWDYSLNKLKPDEISYGTTKKYYFKCSRKLHKSELKCINSFTNVQKRSMDCKLCNSFAQWGIDNLGEDFLEKYWDYEKNTEDPWKVSRGTDSKKVWIKCQEKDYHGSYDVFPSNFIYNNSRCPYCYSSYGKVRPLDSLGKLLEDKNLLHLYSDKNIKSPYEYSPFSNEYVYFKCNNNIHKDYYRRISGSNVYNFRCPECQYSKGEEAISNYFNKKGYIKITQIEHENIKDKNFKYFIHQKTFDNLLGLGGGNLSYDFYLPQHNLLIEYQGEFHDYEQRGEYKRTKYLMNNLEKQKEHDDRKKEYAKYNNINFLEIWYYDFDNIEEILNQYLNGLKVVV